MRTIKTRPVKFDNDDEGTDNESGDETERDEIEEIEELFDLAEEKNWNSVIAFSREY